MNTYTKSKEFINELISFQQKWFPEHSLLGTEVINAICKTIQFYNATITASKEEE